MHTKRILLTVALLKTTIAIPFNDMGNSPGNILVSNPSKQQVTLAEAFTTGAGNTDNAKTNDGTGTAGNDVYNCYYGGWESFPPSEEWASFEKMWSFAQTALEESCASTLSFGPGDSSAQIQDIYDSIQQVAESSLVDHRFILVTILQESSGCVNVNTSTNPDPSQPDKPGIMQSDGGVTFIGNGASPSKQASSITQMIIDGTQGTAYGDGLVQCINSYGNIYEAARCYNSGSVDPSNLNNGEGATNSYVNDIANRMTGWLYTKNQYKSCASKPSSPYPKDTCTWGCFGWDCNSSSPCQSAYSCVSGTCSDCTWGCDGWSCSAASPCNADYTCVSGYCHNSGPATKN